MANEIVIGIESAIAGGSIALVTPGSVLARWSSDENVARSELLLPRISEMLLKASVDRGQVTRVAVSIGPGSFTGIRIGIATALGLAKALAVPFVGISTLKALARGPEQEDDRVVVLPIGRDGYCWQEFRSGADSLVELPVRSGKLPELLEDLGATASRIICHHAAFEALVASELELDQSRMINAGSDLALRIASDAFRFDDGLVPLYARETYPAPAGESRAQPTG